MDDNLKSEFGHQKIVEFQAEFPKMANSTSEFGRARPRDVTGLVCSRLGVSPISLCRCYPPFYEDIKCVTVIYFSMSASFTVALYF